MIRRHPLVVTRLIDFQARYQQKHCCAAGKSPWIHFTGIQADKVGIESSPWCAVQ